MPRRQNRKAGPKYSRGHTKSWIIGILLDYPDGIEEPELRGMIKAELNVRDPKGIKKHLGDLEKEGTLVKKGEDGKENVWRVDHTLDGFQRVAKYFLKSNNEFKFIRSKYAQRTINEELVDHFAENWGRAYLKTDIEPTSTYNERSLEDFYYSLKVIKKNDLVEIVKASPGALHVLLFPENYQEKRISTLDDLFLLPFIQDMAFGLAPDRLLLYEIKLDYRKVVKKAVNEVWIDPYDVTTKPAKALDGNALREAVKDVWIDPYPIFKVESKLGVGDAVTLLSKEFMRMRLDPEKFNKLYEIGIKKLYGD